MKTEWLVMIRTAFAQETVLYSQKEKMMKCVVCHGDDVRQGTVKEEVPTGQNENIRLRHIGV
jgi:hypothetical protein